MSYDPFGRGPHPVGVRSLELASGVASRRLPLEVWYPAHENELGRDLAASDRDSFELLQGLRLWQSARRDARAADQRFPLLVFSHGFGSHRRQSSFICTHLASHGYVVAAPDHVGNTFYDLMQALSDGTQGQLTLEAAMPSVVKNRPADVHRVIDRLLERASEFHTDPEPGVGVIGHSFGGWTALSAPADDQRIAVCVALAPAGGETHLPAEALIQGLRLERQHTLPTLVIAADRDSLLPLEGIRAVYQRLAPPKRLVVLERTDHMHFCDNAQAAHEMFRQLPFGEAGFGGAVRRMGPFSELTPEKAVHAALRGLCLAEADAELKGLEGAREFRATRLAAALDGQGVVADLS